MDTFTYDVERFRSGAGLFSPQVDGDSWLLFHGTSSLCEDAIEKDGLRWLDSQFSRSDTAAVVSLFERLEYSGSRDLLQAGIGVLRHFSLAHDFRAGTNKPIFLGETSRRCHLYATADFAGGETARALRYSLEDLEGFLSDESVRDSYYAAERSKRQRYNLTPLRVTPSVVSNVRAEFEQLAGTRRRAEALKAAHTHGVVYALRFQPEDLKFLSAAGGMGIHARVPLASNRIIAKVRVPQDAVHAHEDDRKIERLLDPCDIVYQLAHQGQAG